MRSLLVSIAGHAAEHFDRFEEKVEIGFSRNKSAFRKNLEKRGIKNIGERISESEYESLEEISAVQKIDGEIRFFSKDDLTLKEFSE